MLAECPGIQVVGLEEDPVKALEAMRRCQPEVILVEEVDEPFDPAQAERMEVFLRRAAAGRVVALSCARSAATVYDRQQFLLSDPDELAQIILGYMPASSAPRS